MRGRGLKVLTVRVLVALVGLVLLALLGVWLFVRASLAQLDGTITAPGLAAPVTVERDARGVPLISGTNRLDVAYATGYVHAQERFFQMDLLRRVGAGELAELFLMHLPDFSDLLHPRYSGLPDMVQSVQFAVPGDDVRTTHLLHPPHLSHHPHQPPLPQPSPGDPAVSRGDHMIHAPALVYSTRNRAGRALSPYAVAVLARCMERAPLLRLALHPRDAQHPALMRHMQALLVELLHTHAPMTKATFAVRIATSMGPSAPPTPSAGGHNRHSTKDGRCAPLLP